MRKSVNLQNLRMKNLHLKHVKTRLERKYAYANYFRKKHAKMIKSLKNELKVKNNFISELEKKLNFCEEHRKNMYNTCQIYIKQIEENNILLTKFNNEINQLKAKTTQFSIETCENQENLKNSLNQVKEISENYQNLQKIISEILLIFSVKSQDLLIPDLKKVAKVLLILPKLQGFVREVYKLLCESYKTPIKTPESALSYIKELILSQNEIKKVCGNHENIGLFLRKILESNEKFTTVFFSRNFIIFR